MWSKIVTFIFRDTLEKIIEEQLRRNEDRAEEALKGLSKEDLLEYLLQNAHLRHHSRTTVLCWRLKTIREKMQ